MPTMLCKLAARHPSDIGVREQQTKYMSCACERALRQLEEVCHYCKAGTKGTRCKLSDQLTSGLMVVAALMLMRLV